MFDGFYSGSLIHRLQPVLYSSIDLLCYILSECRFNNPLFIVFITDKGNLHQAIRIFGRSAQRKVKASDVAKLLQIQIQYPVKYVRGQRPEAWMTIIGAGAANRF